MYIFIYIYIYIHIYIYIYIYTYIQYRAEGSIDGSVDDDMVSRDTAVTKDDLDGALETLRVEICTDFKSTMANTEQSVITKFTGAIRNYDAATQARFATIEANTKALGGRIDKVELDQRGFRTEIDKLRNEPGMAQSAHTPTRSDIADEEWDRKPDLTLVRLNTAELVAKEAILDTAREWIGDMGVREEWEVRGPERGLSERYGRFPIFFCVLLGRDPGTLKSDIV